MLEQDQLENEKINVLIQEIKVRAYTSLLSTILCIAAVMIFAVSPYGWLYATAVAVTNWVGEELVPTLHLQQRLTSASKQDKIIYYDKLLDTCLDALGIVGLGLFACTPLGLVTAGAVGSYLSLATLSVSIAKYVISKIQKKYFRGPRIISCRNQVFSPRGSEKK